MWSPIHPSWNQLPHLARQFLAIASDRHRDIEAHEILEDLSGCPELNGRRRSNMPTRATQRTSRPTAVRAESERSLMVLVELAEFVVDRNLEGLLFKIRLHDRGSHITR